MKNSHDNLEVEAHHWRYENGTSRKFTLGTETVDRIPIGWYCWCYTNDPDLFESWMNENCPTAESVWRFNSGSPHWTVAIFDEVEATMFMLRWL